MNEVKRRFGWVLAAGLGAAAVVAVWGIHDGLAPVAAETPRGLAGWEYATLLLRDGQRPATQEGGAPDPPVFSRRDHGITVRPTPEALTGGITSRQQGLGGYILETRSVHDPRVAALDIFGERGWEAVSMTRTDDGLLVLFKRPPLP